jgi:hypothetical protein
MESDLCKIDLLTQSHFYLEKISNLRRLRCSLQIKGYRSTHIFPRTLSWGLHLFELALRNFHGPIVVGPQPRVGEISPTIVYILYIYIGV